MKMMTYGGPKHLGKAGKNVPQASFQFFYVSKLHITLHYSSQNNQEENHSSHLPAVNRRFPRA